MLNYNVHSSINYKSHAKGMINDQSIQFDLKCAQDCFMYSTVKWTNMEIAKRPRATYGIYYPGVYGKKHSQYPSKR